MSLGFIYILVAVAIALYYMDKHGGENPEDIAADQASTTGPSGPSTAEQRAAALRAAQLRKAQIDATR